MLELVSDELTGAEFFEFKLGVFMDLSSDGLQPSNGDIVVSCVQEEGRKGVMKGFKKGRTRLQQEAA